MSQEYHDLSFKCTYHSRKRLYLGFWKAKTLVNNKVYEFKFEITNVADKVFPGGTLEFHGFHVDIPRSSLSQPPQTITIGPNGPKTPTFKIPSLKPGETKKSSIDILKFNTIETIRMVGTLKSDDNLKVMHRQAGTRKLNGRWTTGSSSGLELFLNINNQDVIRSKTVLYIVIVALVLNLINFVTTWYKIALNWIFNIISR